MNDGDIRFLTLCMIIGIIGGVTYSLLVTRIDILEKTLQDMVLDLVPKKDEEKSSGGDT